MIVKTPKVKILIVEHELSLAQDISNRLTAINYRTVGIASTAFKALEILKEGTDIDIILIDISLKGDADGIELATFINAKYDIPFILLTSKADNKTIALTNNTRHYAYKIKPFNKRQVSIAIELALFNYHNKKSKTNLIMGKTVVGADCSKMQISDSLFLKKNHHFERVPLKEIMFLQADSNYCTVHAKSGRYVYSTVLKNIEAKLPQNQFLRTHRSFVINMNLISGYEGNMLFIGNKKIPVSKAHRDQVFDLFHTI